MHPSLEHLIHLQQIESESERRRRWQAELPQKLAALDAKVAGRRDAKEAVAHQLAENQASRRALDKELAVVQGRLTKFKDQLMEVKTNKEYTAMQHEIATAGDGVRTFEDQILELMLQADELTAGLKAAEAALAEETALAAAARLALEADQHRTESELSTLTADRAAVERAMPRDLVRLFVDVAAKRRGIAVAAIKDGRCDACQVRLRPQLVMEARRGDKVTQCESCSRLLYVPAAPDPPAPTSAAV